MALELYKPYKGYSNYASSNKVDPTRCACKVIRGGRWSSSGQCGAKAKYDAVIEGQAVRVCHMHRPETVAAKKAEADAKYAAHKRELDRRFTRPGDYRKALQSIADGHNDPRTVAREILEKWGDLE